MLKYLNGTNSDKLTISAGSEKAIENLDWFVDAAFAVHPDMKGHTGMAMKFRGGTGAPLTTSVKQKLNTSSSTTCELVAVDQVLPLILWTLYFLKNKELKLKKISYTRTIRVQSYWRKMVSAVLVREHVRWTFVTLW